MWHGIKPTSDVFKNWLKHAGVGSFSSWSHTEGAAAENAIYVASLVSDYMTSSHC